MPELNLKVKIFGRPYKPIALGLIFWCISVLTASNEGFSGSPHFKLSIIVSSLTVSVLLLAWLMKSQRLAEAGLLLASFGGMFAFLDVLFRRGIFDHHIWSNLAVVVIASGSYLLERRDPGGWNE